MTSGFSARALRVALGLTLVSGVLIAVAPVAQAVLPTAFDSYTSAGAQPITFAAGGTGASPSTLQFNIDTSSATEDVTDPYVYNYAPSGANFCNGYYSGSGYRKSLFLAVKPGRGQLVLSNNASANSPFDVITGLYQASTGTFPPDPNTNLSQVDGVLSGATEQDDPITYYTQANHYYVIEYVQCTSGAPVSMIANLSFVPSPSNDDMYNSKANASTATVVSGAAPLAAGGYTVSGDNVGATSGTYDPQNDSTYVYYSDPNDSQLYGYAKHNLWWSWVPSSTGQVTISTAGSSLDTGLVLSSTPGSPTAIGSLTTIDQNDNASASTKTSVITAHVTAGTQYVIMLDGAPLPNLSDTAVGEFTLNVSEIAAPANDLYANAQALSSTNTGSVSGTTIGAGTETNDPYTYYSSAGSTVWYSFKAPATAMYEFDTLATPGAASAVPDTVMGIGVKGATLSNVSLTDTNDNATADTVLSRVTSQLTKDTTYVIVVDGINDNVNPITGPFVLSWSVVDSSPPITTVTSPAANQLFAVGTSTLPVSATVTDGTGVASVQFAVDNQTNWVNATHGAGNAWTGSVDISALQVGVHTLYVDSTDTAFDKNHAISTVSFVVGTVPGPPTGLTVTPGNTTVKVGWTAPTGNFGSSITGYTVTASPGGATCTAAASTLNCTVTGLTDGVQYTFSVVATNGAGNSSPATITGTPIGLAPLTGLTATPGNTTVKVGWAAPTGPLGSTITGYTVTASPGGATCTASASTLNCTVAGLTDGVQYTFSVVATDGISNSAPATITGTPIPLGAPTKIKGVAGPKKGQATITFVAPKGGKVTDYILQIKVKGKWVTYKDGKSAATKILVKGLKSKAAYTAHLTAVPSVGKATTSASFTFKAK